MCIKNSLNNIGHSCHAIRSVLLKDCRFLCVVKTDVSGYGVVVQPPPVSCARLPARRKIIACWTKRF